MNFQEQKFADLNVTDPFFDSLRNDYPGFNNWFEKKAVQGEEALVIYNQTSEIVGFVYLKYDEFESLVLDTHTINPKKRIKIGTFKLSTEIQGNRVGEGAIGYILLQWQDSNIDELYVTVFEKHKSLIILLEKYGFLVLDEIKMEKEYILKIKILLILVAHLNPFPIFQKKISDMLN